MSRRLWVALWLLAMASGWWTGAVWSDEVATPGAPAIEKPSGDDYELYKVFVDTLDQVQRNFVHDVSRRELIEAAIEGMLSRLEDPYSSYISPEDISRFKTSVESRFGGIGIQVEVEGGQLKILSPLRGTPAYRAGLIAGDRIVEIEGQSTDGISIDEAVRQLKGEAGTTVTIGVIHPQESEIRRVTLEREVIEVETVLGDRRKFDDSWEFMLDPEKKIGYIRVTAFSRDTARDLTAALESLVASGLRGLILDLRFNPGGLLSSAIEISDLFVAEGRIVSTEGRNSAERVWDARREGTFEGFPMAILVNRYSASASEIVSACLQDHARAVVVGERTWGKGSVQNVIELEGGRSALKLTTASYKRPSGKKIHRFPEDDEDDQWGVLPNDGFELKLDNQEMRALADARRARDVLVPHAVANQQASSAGGSESKPAEAPAASEASPAETPAASEPPAAPAETPAAGSSSTDTPADPSSEETPTDAAASPEAPPPAPAAEASNLPDSTSPVDRQLQKALEYLHEQLAQAG